MPASFLHKVADRFSPEQASRILKALRLAEDIHFGQTRASGEDFLIHPLCVAETLLDWGVSSELIIAALLHDTVEDGTLTISKIQKLFGVEVATYVFALTKHFFHQGVTENSISFLKESPNILIIKLADRLHNMRTLSSMSKVSQKKNSLETLAVYVPVARFFKMYEVADELKKLAKKYAQ